MDRYAKISFIIVIVGLIIAVIFYLYINSTIFNIFSIFADTNQTTQNTNCTQLISGTIPNSYMLDNITTKVTLKNDDEIIASAKTNDKYFLLFSKSRPFNGKWFINASKQHSDGSTTETVNEIANISCNISITGLDIKLEDQ